MGLNWASTWQKRQSIQKEVCGVVEWVFKKKLSLISIFLRCTFRKKFHRGEDHLFSPESWPSPVELDIPEQCKGPVLPYEDLEEVSTNQRIIFRLILMFHRSIRFWCGLFTVMNRILNS